MKKKIKLNSVEIQSNFNRVVNAEGLIKQLPTDHDGRNSWLLNFGKSIEAKKLRKNRGLKFDKKTQSCELIGDDDEKKPEYGKCPECGTNIQIWNCSCGDGHPY